MAFQSHFLIKNIEKDMKRKYWCQNKNLEIKLLVMFVREVKVHP